MSLLFRELVAHAVHLRKELHQNPEQTWKEFETARRIRAELDRLGIAWRACADTGTVADLGSGEGRIALRADIDALPLTEATGKAHASRAPGVMHACGHDGHTASLLAAAAWMKANASHLKAPVRFLFQPAEEGGHGAKSMIEEGCLDGVSAIYGYHNLPTMPFGRAAVPAGPVMVSNGYFRIVVEGSGGHASTPEVCRDPILAASQFIDSVQQVVSRNVAPQTAAVITVTKFHGGTARNIIPDRVELEGTIRAAETELRDRLARRVEQVLQGTCAAAGVTGQYEFSPAYQATVNHPDQAAHYHAAFSGELGAEFSYREGVPFMGGEDFSYYLKEVPGAYALVGSGTTTDDPPLHSPRFDYNDELVPLMVRVWSRLVGAPLPE